MGIDNCFKAGVVICAMAFLPSVSQAQVDTCVPTAANEHSYMGGSTREATHLLDDMQYDARQVAHHAQLMDNFAYHTSFAWNTIGIELRRIKSEINDIGKRLCRLERMENVVPLSERNAIQSVTPLVREMADNTDSAIHFRNLHHSGLWAPSFTADAQNLQNEAHTMIRRLHRSEEMAG